MPAVDIRTPLPAGGGGSYPPPPGLFTCFPGVPLPTPSSWLDRFFASLAARRPVDASFIGIPGHDHRLPDCSENGAGDGLATVRGLLEEARALDLFSASPVERLDLHLAVGALELEERELTSSQFQWGNPAYHTGEALFGFLSLFLSDFAPLDERVEAATERLEAIAGFLASARDAVRSAPATWTSRALRECEGARALFGRGIPMLAAQEGIRSSAFLAAATRAGAAFESHAGRLEGELRFQLRPDVAYGEDRFHEVLERGHALNMTPDELAEYATEELRKARTWTALDAGNLGADSPDELLALLPGIHPTEAEYLPRYRELWDEVRRLTEEQEILAWPDAPIRFVPRPEWVRETAPFLYFLFYRSPSALRRPEVHDYLVTPIEAEMPAEERRRLLRATNQSVIKLNHVVHHGSIGHHVQNGHAFRAPSRVGRIAAVDCASRIALHSGGTMAEGWACYATDLMADAGFLTPLERFAEEAGRARMCARAVVDVRLHQGRFTLEEATTFYQEAAGMTPEAAHDEAVKNSMFPGAAVIYLMGRDTIHHLRDEVMTIQGSDFSLKAFHDRFLSYGSIPVTLIAKDMLPWARGSEDIQRDERGSTGGPE